MALLLTFCVFCGLLAGGVIVIMIVIHSNTRAQVRVSFSSSSTDWYLVNQLEIFDAHARVVGQVQRGSMVKLSKHHAKPANLNAADGPLFVGGPPGYVVDVLTSPHVKQPLSVMSMTGKQWWYTRDAVQICPKPLALPDNEVARDAILAALEAWTSGMAFDYVCRVQKPINRHSLLEHLVALNGSTIQLPTERAGFI